MAADSGSGGRDCSRNSDTSGPASEIYHLIINKLHFHSTITSSEPSKDFSNIKSRNPMGSGQVEKQI